MSAQGWIVLVIVAGVAVGVVYRLARGSGGKGGGSCCGGGDACPSKPKKP